jgi:hypothetical protein
LKRKYKLVSELTPEELEARRAYDREYYWKKARSKKLKQRRLAMLEKL